MEIIGNQSSFKIALIIGGTIGIILAWIFIWIQHKANINRIP